MADHSQMMNENFSPQLNQSVGVMRFGTGKPIIATNLAAPFNMQELITDQIQVIRQKLEVSRVIHTLLGIGE
ncbi:hypothetical protein [Pedobacter suwonensis]|uniref:hypothetical protein n=1 Tax=Pedobacter suwonensis TaxID=332999 RepID=UPI0011A047F7|nr:hypothetical protein [Pedobacter suwonensis]